MRVNGIKVFDPAFKTTLKAETDVDPLALPNDTSPPDVFVALVRKLFETLKRDGVLANLAPGSAGSPLPPMVRVESSRGGPWSGMSRWGPLHSRFRISSRSAAPIDRCTQGAGYGKFTTDPVRRAFADEALIPVCPPARAAALEGGGD